MRKRIEFKIGLLLLGTALALNALTVTPQFILGLLFGLGLCLEMIGLLPERIYHKIKDRKRSLLRLLRLR